MRDVKVEKFSGPLDLLLQLIEQQQLDISQVSLAKVTEQYIQSLQAMAELPVDELADFLVVAAKLLLIKSRLLVPTDELPADDAGLDLEKQLKMYREFVEASKKVEKIWNKHKAVWAREGSAMLEPIFHPPEHLVTNDLHDLMFGVLKELEPLTRLPQTVIVRTINIREKIGQIKDRLLKNPKTSFHNLLQLANSKTDVIVTFLAVLELVKLRSVSVSQDKQHGDVDISLLSADQPITMDVASV